MPAFKDEEIASEALRGTLKPRYRLKIKNVMVLLACAAVTGAVALVASKLRPGAVATASHAVIAQPHAANVSVEKAQPPTSAETLKPVEPASKAPAAAPAPAQAAAAKPAPVTLRSSGIFGKTHALLRSGDAAGAIEALKEALPGTQDEAERKEALVLEARALLAQGKVEEARAKFEPLAFMSTDNETGTDALLGNYWCQAGSLARCRDEELEQVYKGFESWGAASAAVEQARRLETKAGGELAVLEKARTLYQQALDCGKLDQANDAKCLERLKELTDRLILDPKVACLSPKAVLHKVEPGEVLEKIVRRHRVNLGQVKRINRLNDKLVIRAGQTLKMLPGEVVYKVDRTRLIGTLYVDGVFLRRYPVGIGPGNATPNGNYTIVTKVANPDWYFEGKKIPFGDARNILGTRWMGFDPTENGGQGASLGVHGTALPQSVPGRESKGCVRMLNTDVEELYDFMPQGGRVQIAD